MSREGKAANGWPVIVCHRHIDSPPSADSHGGLTYERRRPNSQDFQYLHDFASSNGTTGSRSLLDAEKRGVPGTEISDP